jgi:hypothetical protein
VSTEIAARQIIIPYTTHLQVHVKPEDAVALVLTASSERGVRNASNVAGQVVVVGAISSLFNLVISNAILSTA